MKPTKLTNVLFWVFVVAVVAIVVSVTAGTYIQYKVACADPDVSEGISMVYQVKTSAVKVWMTIFNF